MVHLITGKRKASKHLKIMDIKVIGLITPIAEHFQHQKSHLARHSYFFKEFAAWGTEQMWVEKNKDTKFTTINTNNKSYPWPLASLLVFQIGELWSSTSRGKSEGKMFLEDLEGHELCFDAVENRVSYIIMAFVISKEDSL